MLRISDEREMDEHRKKRALISVFVHHAYRPELIDVVLGMRRGFDPHVQSAWDMLIPYVKGDYAVNSNLRSDEYGVELARRIINRHRLEHRELPALIFEYVPDEEYFFVKLGDRTADEIVEIIGTIADMAVDEFENGPSDVNEFRENLHHRIAIYLRQRKALSIISKTCPKLAGALGVAGDVKGLFN